MEVTPIPGTLVLAPVAPVKRAAPVRRGVKTARADEPDRPIPEPAPGTGELVDLYV